MWTREMTDLLDVLPYYLLVALPVFIILSPINPVDAASELDVHRLAQFELAGNTHGSKQVWKNNQKVKSKIVGRIMRSFLKYCNTLRLP